MFRITSSFTCQLISVIIPTLVIIHHSFTPSLQAQNLPFQQTLPTLILLLSWTAFTITRLDRTYHASRFIFCWFFFNFSVCSMWSTKLHGCTAAFYCTLNTEHRIVSYRPQTVTHLGTNRVWHMLIEANALPLSQTANSALWTPLFTTNGSEK